AEHRAALPAVYGAEVGDLDGFVRQFRRDVRHLQRSAGRGSVAAGGRVYTGLSAEAGGVSGGAAALAGKRWQDTKASARVCDGRQAASRRAICAGYPSGCDTCGENSVKNTSPQRHKDTKNPVSSCLCAFV